MYCFEFSKGIKKTLSNYTLIFFWFTLYFDILNKPKFWDINKNLKG